MSNDYKTAEIAERIETAIKSEKTDISDFGIATYSVNTEDHEFSDFFQTREQKVRDCEITELLTTYVDAYKEKVNKQKTYRKTLMILCTVIIALFSVAFLTLLLYFGFRTGDADTTNIVSLVSICVTFLASILGLVTIITKYCFPEDDEQYITKIVEVIQQNDLQHKIENMKNTKQDNDPERGIQ